MCGRFTLFSDVKDLAAHFEVDEVRAEPLPARFNVAPTLEVYAVIDREQQRRLGTLQWGFIPWFAKERKPGPINARGESLMDKPMFRDAFERKRCIIPADGFYEWRRDGERKTPFYISSGDGEPLAFAGLWSTWRPRDDPDAEPVRTCTIVTTAPDPRIRDLHDRMPAMLPRDEWAEWLDPDNRDTTALARLLVPEAPHPLLVHEVEPLVNDVRNDAPELVAPVR